MPALVASLSKSASKSQLFTRLGLSPENADHRRLYDLMKVRACRSGANVVITDAPKTEAAEGRQRIVAFHRTGDLTGRDLEPEGESSFPSSLVDEQIFDAEVAYIFRNAQPATKILYNLAQEEFAPHSTNWIIRWMLWHVIRYRDGRQKPRAGRSASTSEDGALSEQAPS